MPVNKLRQKKTWAHFYFTSLPYANTTTQLYQKMSNIELLRNTLFVFVLFCIFRNDPLFKFSNKGTRRSRFHRLY